MLKLDSGFTEFKLNYSATENVLAGRFISSNIFTAGGHNWKIHCYPHGQNSESGEYLSLYFRLLSGSKEVKTIIEAFVIGRNGEPSTVYRNRHMMVFGPGNGTGTQASMRGWSEFAKRSNLESDCVDDGWVTFICGVIVLRESSTLDNSIPVPSSDIQSHLGSLLESAEGTDVSFSVNGKMFDAHRAVLAARSPVFKAQLLGSMAEAKMACITLHDIEPAAFELLLQFMYTDILPGDDQLGDSAIDMFQHLLAAADRYALIRLKLMCAQKLWENMSVDIAASALRCAEMYNCPELRSRCIDFMVAEDNFKKVVLTEDFMRLGLSSPSVITDLKQRVEDKTLGCSSMYI